MYSFYYYYYDLDFVLALESDFELRADDRLLRDADDDDDADDVLYTHPPRCFLEFFLFFCPVCSATLLFLCLTSI